MVVVKEDVYETDLYNFDTLACSSFISMPVYDDGNIRCENKGENMDVQVVTEIVDAAFSALEKQFAGNNIMLLFISSIEAVVNNLIPTIVNDLNAVTKK